MKKYRKIEHLESQHQVASVRLFYVRCDSKHGISVGLYRGEGFGGSSVWSIYEDWQDVPQGGTEVVDASKQGYAGKRKMENN